MMTDRRDAPPGALSLGPQIAAHSGLTREMEVRIHETWGNPWLLYAPEYCFGCGSKLVIDRRPSGMFSTRDGTEYDEARLRCPRWLGFRSQHVKSDWRLV